MEQLGRDLRHAVRSLRRAPLFGAVIVATLALGIGVGTTLFTFVNAVLLRPLPVARPGEMVHLYSSWEGEPWASSSLPDLRDLQEGTTAVELFGHASSIATLQQGGRSRMVVGEIVTGNAFGVIEVEPALGRLILPADDRPGAARALVLAHAFWERELGADPAAVGRTLRLNGQPYAVVGVAPRDFHGLMPGLAPDFWAPAVRVGELDAAGQINSVPGETGDVLRERRGYRWMWVKGRLAPGASVAQARAQAGAVMARLAREHRLTNEGKRAVVQPLGAVRLHPQVDGVLTAASTVLLGSAALLLVVVCANLANMVLSRAIGKQREVSIRLALGSSRGRLLRGLMTESFLLAFAGAALGLLLSRVATALLLRALPPLPFEIGVDVATDARVTLFAVSLAAGAALLFGLLPARQTARRDLAGELRGGARASEGRARAWSLRNGLVVAQVAVSMVLLVAAALLGRSFAAVRALDVGLQPQRIAAVGLNLGMHGYDQERATALLRELRRRAEGVPGVESAAIATRVPFDVNSHTTELFPDSRPIVPGKPGVNTDMTAVEPGYFATIGVTLLQGRDFDSRDVLGAPRVAIVNQTMARALWEGSALGRTFRSSPTDAEPTTIVGVVADHKVRSVGEDPRAFVHFPFAQRGNTSAYVLARAERGDGDPLVASLRRLALELDPELALTQTTTLAEFQAVTLYPVRMGATLLGAFGLLALALAGVGLYGVLAYAVARRQRELGIRLAVGAHPARLLRLVVGRGLRLLAVGLVAGLAVAAAATRLLSGALHGVSALDPVAFGAAAGILLLAGAAANVIPAARAARTDPAVVLREE